MTDEDDKSKDVIDRYIPGDSANKTGNKNGGEETSTTESSKIKQSPNNIKESNKSEQSDDRTNKSSEDSEDTVKNRESVLMYLPDEVRQELSIRFDELNAEHKRQYGEAMEKNRDYYPAVILAGLTDKELEDILEL